jgi:hypothetical protein
VVSIDEEKTMSDVNYATVCGLYCGECEYLGKNCRGCGYVEGKTFWAVQLPSGTCPFYDCCRNQKSLEHCGVCESFPCRLFSEMRDPSWSDEEFQQSLTKRLAALRRRAEIGTATWLTEAASH